MNKAEQAAFKDLQNQAALRWPTFVEPKPMNEDEVRAAAIPLDGIGRSHAAECYFFNAHFGFSSSQPTITKGWSTPTAHGTMDSGRFGGSQGRGRPYRTYTEAAQAARWDICRKFAVFLGNCDRLIEAGEA